MWLVPLLLVLCGQTDARFDNLHASFSQVVSKLSAGEPISAELLATRAAEWKKLYKSQPEEAFRVADLTQSLAKLTGVANFLETAISGVGTVTTTCSTPQIPREYPPGQQPVVPKGPLKPLLSTPFESPRDRCFQTVTIGEVSYFLRLSLDHPLRDAGNSLPSIPLHGYVIKGPPGVDAELFARTSPFHPLAVKDGKFGLHMGRDVMNFETLEHREAYMRTLDPDTEWDAEMITTRRRLSVPTCSPSTSVTTSVPFSETGTGKKMCIVKYILTDGKPILDYSGTAITDALIQEEMRQISQYYTSNSYGAFNFQLPVTVFTVSGTVAAGNSGATTQMLRDWRTANPGVWCTCDAEYILFNYNMGGYNTPGWAGLATLNFQGGWLNGDISPRVWAHEIGHNVGYGHSRQYQLNAAATTWLGAGVIYEYGDPYDLMGGGTIDMNNVTLAENDVAYFGTLYRSFIMTTPWIPASVVTQVGQTIPGGALDIILFPSDRNDITPASLTGNQKLAVHWLRPADISQSMTTAGTVGGGTSTETMLFGRFLFEYKTKVASSQASSGLIVHAAQTSNPVFGVQIDNNPQTAAIGDSPLSFGNTFSDCTYGVHVTGDRTDCPGASAGSMGCANVMLRNGQGGVSGGVNIVVTVTDASTGMTSSTVAVGASVTLNVALSGTGTKTTVIYFDWGDGSISKGSSASHSWTTPGIKVVTVTATTLDSAFTKVLYKVAVGSGLKVTPVVSAPTPILTDAQGVTAGSLGIDSTKTGFTVTMMVQFTDTNQQWHDMWQIGSWTFRASLQSGSSWGFYFTQGQGSANGGPAPYFNKVAQAAFVVTQTGATATVTVYIDGGVYSTRTGVTTAWPTATSTIKVGSYCNCGYYLGGVVSKAKVYNWALSSADLALDAAGVDLTAMSPQSGGSTSGCTAAAPTTPTMPTAPPTTKAPTTVAPTTKAPTLAPTAAPTLQSCVLPTPFPTGYVAGTCTAGATLLSSASCTIQCAPGLTTGGGSAQYSCSNGALTTPTLACTGADPTSVMITTPTATGFTVSALASSGTLRVNIDPNAASALLTVKNNFWAAAVGTTTKEVAATGSLQNLAFTGLVTGTRYCAVAASSASGAAGSSALVASTPTCIVVGLQCTLPTGNPTGWNQALCPLGSTVENTYTCSVSCSAPYTASTGTTQYICNNGVLTQPSLVCVTSAPTPVPTTAKPTAPPTAPTCFDGVQNGNELGVDCGGPDCGPCACGVVVVEETTPTATARAFFGTYINTGSTANSRPVYRHITSNVYLYSQFVSPDTYWLLGPTTDGLNFVAYTLSVAGTAQTIPPNGWKVGSTYTSGTTIQLATRCQTFNGTSECPEVRIDGRNGNASYVNGIWLDQNSPYGGHPTYKHTSLPRYLFWASNAWNIADAVASSSVIAKRASHALNTYVPFTQGYSFDQPWQFLSGASFVSDSMVTSWCLGCIGIRVNSIDLLAQGTYFGNHEMYRAVGQSNMFAFTHGGWAVVPTTFDGVSNPTLGFARDPLAWSPKLIAASFSPSITSTFCTIPAAVPTPSDACFDLSCQACITNPACTFCATGSNVGQQRCLANGIPCSGTTTTAGNCPNVNDLPRSCGPLVSPQNAVPATCNGTLGAACVFACATGYNATGSTTRTCQSGPATWDGTPLTCNPKSCPAITAPTGGSTVTSCAGKVEGDTCSFACNYGFAGTGSYVVTCRNGAWVGTQLTCTRIACPTVSSGTNAVAATCAGRVHGDNCTFSCNAGYSPATSTLTCDAGTWVGNVAQCAATSCPILSSPFGANPATCAAKVSGDVCTFSCGAGFVAAGSASRTCTNGAWTGTPFTCTAADSCPSLIAPYPGSRSLACNNAKSTDTCTQVCQPGYSQGGDSTRTCGASFTWGGNPLTCTPLACPTLSNPPGAVASNCTGKVEGDTCTFFCDDGYVQFSGQATRTCTNQAWAGTPLTCNLKVCPDLNPPPNAIGPACTQTLNKDTCSWVCAVGYAPKTYSISCLDGAWANVPALQCVQTTCPDLLAPVGGTGAACLGVTHGGTCTFSCNAGFTPNLYASRTCQDGVWSGQPFTCTSATACPALESPAGANPASCSNKVLGESCSFTCATGYTTLSGDNTRLCGTGQTWSGNMLQCTPKVCYDLPSPVNAVPRVCSNMTEGQTCLHQCDSESSPVGSTLRTCTNGAWDGVPLQCPLRVCPGLFAPINSTQFGSSCQGYESGSQCSFSCIPGYITVGDPVRLCMQGAWRGTVLQCVDPSTQYVWSGSAWGACTATCGAATQTRTVNCVDLFNASAVVDPSVCTNLGIHEAPTIQACANPACQSFAWVNGTWGACTQACGGGQSQRTVQCQATIGTGPTASTSIVSDDQCNLATKPPTVQSCNTQVCTTSTWSSTLWSFCSALCGGGTQTRVVTCLDSNLNAQPDSNCSSMGPKPVSVQACNLDQCLTYKWRVCALDPCTAPCNGAGTGLGMIGYQYREIFCMRNTDGHRVDDTLCSATPKPTDNVEGCNGFPCTKSYWMTSRWTPCNATAANGFGSRTRTYHCHFADGRNALNSECVANAGTPPTIEEGCNINVCQGEAFVVAGPAESGLTPETQMYIGIGVGALIVVLLAIALTVWCIKRRGGRTTHTQTTKQLQTEMSTEYVPKSYGSQNRGPAPAPPAHAPSRLPPGWTKMQTETGDVYYENSATGETSWSPPSY